VIVVLSNAASGFNEEYWRIIDSEGKIALPLVDKVSVNGLTPKEATAVIRRAYSAAESEIAVRVRRCEN